MEYERPGYIFNVYSHKYVKIGSRVYNKLLRDGIFNANNTPKPNNVVYEAENKEEAKKVRERIKLKEPDKTLKVVDNKIIKINKKLTNNEYNDKIISASARVLKRMKDNKDEIDNNNIDEYIRKQIYREIVLSDNNIIAPNINNKNKRNARQIKHYTSKARTTNINNDNRLYHIDHNEDFRYDNEDTAEISEEDLTTRQPINNIKKSGSKRFKIKYASETDN